MTDRTVRVRVTANNSDFDRAMDGSSGRVSTLASRLEAADGRLANLVQTGLALAPALVPIAAVGIPAVAGLSAELGFAAAGAGTALLAFQGVGDAVKALNAYALVPTQANLDKVHQTMSQLGPDAREFARYVVSDLEPALKQLERVSAAGIFPGLEQGTQSLLTRLPQVKRILDTISLTTGDLLRQGGHSLASNRFDDFFRFLQEDAQPILTDFGKTAGNFIEGTAHLFVAFEPLERQVADGFLHLSQSYDRWAHGLDDSDQFQQFVDYVQHNGPEVVDTLESLANTLLQISEAAAPIGADLLPVIRTTSDVIGNIADSGAGAVLVALAAGLGAYGRALALLKVVGLRGGGNGFLGRAIDVPAMKTATRQLYAVATAQDRVRLSYREMSLAYSSSPQIRQGLASFGKAAAVGAGLALTQTDIAQKTGLANTATLGLIGTLAGPWGVAIGSAVGLAEDFAASNNDVESAVRAADLAIRSGDPDALTRSYAQLTAQASKLATENDFSRGVGFLNGSMDDLKFKAEDVQAALDIAMKPSPVNDLADALGGGLRDALHVTDRDFHRAAQSAEDFQNEVIQINDLLSKRADFRSYEAALDDFVSTFKKHRKALDDVGLEGGRANEQALDTIAASAVKYAQTLNGLRRVDFLAHARQQFLDAAATLKIPRKEAEGLANDLGLLAKQKVKPKVEIDGVEKGTNQVTALDKFFDHLDRKNAEPAVHVHIDDAGLVALQQRLNAVGHDVYVGIHTFLSGGDGGKHKADGGLMTGPGGPRDDRIPAWLSNGEYVVRSAAVDHYGVDFMHQLNTMRLAQGGYLSRPVAATRSTSTTNYYTSGSDAAAMRALKAELAALRETVGNLGTDVYDGARDGIAGRQGRTANRRRPGG